MEFLNQTDQISPSVYSDNASLDHIRKKSLTDSPAAIKAAAKEFESFFMNMMLKSMRQASEVIGDESMISSPQEKMFVGMLDEQMSVELSQKGSLGIAELITRNLSKNTAEGFDITGPRQKPRTEFGENVQSKIKENESISIDEPVEKLAGLTVNNISKSELGKAATILPESEMLNNQVEVSQPSKKSMFDSVNSFVNQLMPLANKAAEKIGLDPKILLAQAALETGWGKHVIHGSNGQSSFNLFGIKGNNGWRGDSVKINTLEVESGEFVQRQEDFRSYSSFENSFDDFVDFVSENPRYQKAMDLVSDAEKFIQSIQDAGYATDPNYAKKIINIFNRNLTD